MERYQWVLLVIAAAAFVWYLGYLGGCRRASGAEMVDDWGHPITARGW
jgi:hypothetical protein